MELIVHSAHYQLILFMIFFSFPTFTDVYSYPPYCCDFILNNIWSSPNRHWKNSTIFLNQSVFSGANILARHQSLNMHCCFFLLIWNNEPSDIEAVSYTHLT